MGLRHISKMFSQISSFLNPVERESKAFLSMALNDFTQMKLDHLHVKRIECDGRLDTARIGNDMDDEISYRQLENYDNLERPQFLIDAMRGLLENSSVINVFEQSEEKIKNKVIKHGELLVSCFNEISDIVPDSKQNDMADLLIENDHFQIALMGCPERLRSRTIHTITDMAVAHGGVASSQADHQNAPDQI